MGSRPPKVCTCTWREGSLRCEIHGTPMTEREAQDLLLGLPRKEQIKRAMLRVIGELSEAVARDNIDNFSFDSWKNIDGDVIAESKFTYRRPNNQRAERP